MQWNGDDDYKEDGEEDKFNVGNGDQGDENDDDDDDDDDDDVDESFSFQIPLFFARQAHASTSSPWHYSLFTSL